MEVSLSLTNWQAEHHRYLNENHLKEKADIGTSISFQKDPFLVIKKRSLTYLIT